MNVYICSAARTAIGTYGGTLRDVHSSELGTAAAKAAIERAGVDKEESTRFCSVRYCRAA